MMEERRRFIRLHTRLTMIFKILDTGKVQRTLTKNVGGIGVCFVSEEQFQPGAKLDIEVKFPDRDTPVRFTADVIWSRPVGEPRKSYQPPTVETGVQFVTIDPKDLALIRQYTALNAPPLGPGER